MQQVIRHVNHQTIGVFFLLFLLVGMLVSPVLMSVGVMGLTANWVINKRFPQLWKTFSKQPALWGLCVLFAWLALSGLWSENMTYWADRMRMKLPFLLLPLGLVSIPRFNKKVYFPLLYLFFVLIVGVCLYLTAWYFLNFDEMTEAYKQGHVLPTPVMHIRFSLMVAYSVAIGVALIQEKWSWKFDWERWGLCVATAFLVVFIHILAVRSGLVALYGLLVYLLVAYVVRSGRWGAGLAALGLMVVLAFSGYKAIPSLKNKIDYTLYNIYHIQRNNNMADLSDSHRVGTIKAGLSIGNNSPWIGEGVGDVKDATELYLQEYFPTVAGFGFTPQSQIVWFYAAAGGIGLVLFLLVTYWPLFYRVAWENPLLGGLLAIALPSFIIEQTLETQLGMTFYLTFLLMAIRHYFIEDHHSYTDEKK